MKTVASLLLFREQTNKISWCQTEQKSKPALNTGGEENRSFIITAIIDIEIQHWQELLSVLFITTWLIYK